MAFELFSQPQPTLTNVSTGTGAAVPVNNGIRHGIYIKWGAGVTAGAVAIEAADVPGYTGTWALLTTINWTAANKLDLFDYTGVVGAIRARVSTNIVGGTISATIQSHMY